MTVIYCNFGDKDTALLKNIWKGLKDVKVIELTGDDVVKEKDIVQNAIKNEENMLLLCGHGSPFGLFSPSFETFAFTPADLKLVKAKNVIGIWCHASRFAEMYHAKGFFSSMFISNLSEAKFNNCYNTTAGKINKATTRFCNRVNKLIKENVPISQWEHILKAQCDYDDEVEAFNYNGLMFFD